MRLGLDLNQAPASDLMRGPALLKGRRAGILAWACVLALAAWIALYWIRALSTPEDSVTTPSSVPVSVPETAQLVASIVGAPLFGQAETTGTGMAPATSLPIKLKGVIAADGGATAAILNAGQTDEFVSLQGEVAPGVRLQAIFPGYVVISRNGRQERVDLEALKFDGPRSGAPPARNRNARRESVRSEPVGEPGFMAAPAPPPSPEVPEPAATAPPSLPVPQGVPPSSIVPQPGPGPAPGFSPGGAPVPMPNSRLPSSDEDAQRVATSGRGHCAQLLSEDMARPSRCHT